MNKMSLKFRAVSQNEYLARTTISSFILELNPTIEQLSDVKTAVSEAVTNCVVHAYDKNDENNENNDILLEAVLDGHILHIQVTDYGRGIENVSDALKPYFTTKKDYDRSGMGFTIMKMFMDEFSVVSQKNVGTTVTMVKNFKKEKVC